VSARIDDTDRLLAGTLSTDPAAGAYDPTGRWPTPEPLSDAGEALPPFPVAALPDWLSRYVASLADVTQSPVDIGGLLALSCLSAATAKRCRVAIGDAWSEPLSLYTVSTAGPSEGKSPVFSALSAPILDRQVEQEVEQRAAIEQRALERRVLEGRITALEKEAISSKGDIDRACAIDSARRLTEELADLPELHAPRLIADDVTTEKLAAIMDGQGGRIAVLSSEGDIFSTIAGRYSSGSSNMGLWLKSWGDPLVLVDRVSRPSLSIVRPSLSIGLTVQPVLLEQIAGNGEFGGRGFLARFLWAVPASKVGARRIDEHPQRPAGEEDYRAAMDRLLSLSPDPDADNPRRWRLLHLSPDAAAALYELRAELEPRMAPYADLADLREWAGKLAVQVARIAGLLHLATHHTRAEPWRIPLAGSTMAAAIEIGRWAIPHAAAALTTRQRPHADAEHVLGWLLSQPADVLSQSAIHRGCKRRGWTVRDHLEPALETLKERGWVRRYTPPTTGRGRPAVYWQVSPLARTALEVP